MFLVNGGSQMDPVFWDVAAMSFLLKPASFKDAGQAGIVWSAVFQLELPTR